MDNPFEAPVSANAFAKTNDLADYEAAGHGARIGAYLIDTVIVMVVVAVLIFAVAFLVASFGAQTGAAVLDEPLAEQITTIAVYVVVAATYIALGLIEGSSWQGSPGKRLLGLRVIHASGRDITPAEGVGRQFLKAIILNLCGLAGLVCLEEPARRGPWDFVLSTRVVRPNRYAEYLSR